MKNPSLGDYFLWEGKFARIIAETDKRVVTIELFENCRCPYCNADLGKELLYVVPSSPRFQNSAEIIQAMKDDGETISLRC